ncbi:MAG TPA: hypothetical protein VN033_01775 [Vulgatibacter sp.]|nr:hypothetical protein [Vulgatibacter sp.]
MDLPSNLDFGDVKVGKEAALPLAIESRTDAPLQVVIRQVVDPYIVDRDLVDLAPRAAAPILVTFAPRVRGEAWMPLALRPCSGCTPTIVQVRGKGVGKELRASPSPAGFDHVALGLTRPQESSITNVGDFDVELAAIEVEGEGFAVDPDGLPDRLAIGEQASGWSSNPVAPATSRRSSWCAPPSSSNGNCGYPSPGSGGRPSRARCVHRIECASGPSRRTRLCRGAWSSRTRARRHVPSGASR